MQIETIFEQPDWRVRAAFFHQFTKANYRPFKQTSEAIISLGLNDSSAAVRRIFIKEIDRPLTPQENQQALLDESPHVRFEAVERTDFYPTEKEFNLCFYDSSIGVRLALLRKEVPLTKEQITHCLQAREKRIRLFIIRARYLSLSPEHIDKSVNDAEWEVRRDLLLRKDLKITPEQQEKTLSDSHPAVRAAALERTELPLNGWQIERAFSYYEKGSNSKEFLPFLHFAEISALLDRRDISLSEQQYRRGLNYTYRNVAVLFAERPDFTPSPDLFSILKRKNSYTLNQLLEKREQEWTQKWEKEALLQQFGNIAPKNNRKTL
jgi:hypothetical protein